MGEKERKGDQQVPIVGKMRSKANQREKLIDATGCQSLLSYSREFLLSHLNFRRKS